MKPNDELEIIRTKYEQAKKLAEEVWIDGDYEGNDNDFYYFQCGFVAGINYEDIQRNKDQKDR
jgi:hypothetical protein